MLTISMPYDTYHRALWWVDHIENQTRGSMSESEQREALNKINFACEQLTDLLKNGA